MSVCFSLYKVLPDVDLLGSKYDFASKELLEEKNNLLDSKDLDMDEFHKIMDDFYGMRFSDGLNHEYLDLVNWSFGPKHKKNRSKNKKNVSNSFNVKVLPTSRGFAYKYLTVDRIAYRQGWFLKKRFFKKPYTIYIATTKEQMDNWFKKYLDVKGRDKRGIECYRKFMDSWEDDCIFCVDF